MKIALGFLLAAVVLASLALAAGPVAWHLAGESAIGARELPRQREAPVAAPPPDLTAVAALAPFGSPAAPTRVAGSVTEETRLDLSLRGVVLAGVDSLAFIASQGATQSYTVGASVRDGVRLTEIFEDYVLLEVGGTVEVLSFPNREAGPKSAGLAAEDAPPDPFDRLRSLIRPATPRPEAEEIIPETTEDYIDLWRERVIRNPKQVLDQIGLTATENGYIINEEHDIGVRLAGLKPGDRVASVNGQAVGDMEEDRRRYGDIAASGVARLEVIRDGQTITMSFPLR
ncbi:MAG: type II secretion system protein N [Pseudomonadota bacterium]